MTIELQCPYHNDNDSKMVLCEVRNVLTDLIVETFHNMVMYQNTTWYTLSLHSVIRQLYLNKLGKRKRSPAANPAWPCCALDRSSPGPVGGPVVTEGSSQL